MHHIAGDTDAFLQAQGDGQCRTVLCKWEWGSCRLAALARILVAAGDVASRAQGNWRWVKVIRTIRLTTWCGSTSWPPSIKKEGYTAKVRVALRLRKHTGDTACNKDVIHRERGVIPSEPGGPNRPSL